MSRCRRGMSLAVTIGVVSLIALLAVATLSLGGRLVQSSTLSARGAGLDGAASLGLVAAMDEWRARKIGQLAIGSSVAFPVAGGASASVSVTTTRVGADVFWIVAEAASAGGARRLENLVVRLRVPDAALVIAEDSTNVASLGFLPVDSISAGADVALPAGATLVNPTGVVHVAGDATLLGGAGDGVLIVEGRLAIVGAVAFAGLIVARNGISIGAAGVAVNGLVRASGNPVIAGTLTETRSVPIVQDVLRQSVRPLPVSGRRWGELY